MNIWVLTSWVTLGSVIATWSMVQLTRIAIALNRIADRLLPPGSATAYGVTRIPKNEEYNSDNQEQSTNVVEQAEFNEPTNQQKNQT